MRNIIYDMTICFIIKCIMFPSIFTIHIVFLEISISDIMRILGIPMLTRTVL